MAEREWKPKETSEYQTLLDLVLSEDIYLINYYGFVYVLICTFFRLFARSPAACRTERHRYNVRRLFGCTTCKRGSKEPRLPTTNYDTPTSSASDKKGDACVRSTEGFEGLHGDKWSEVSFDKAGREFLENRWRAQVPNMEQNVLQISYASDRR